MPQRDATPTQRPRCPRHWIAVLAFITVAAPAALWTWGTPLAARGQSIWHQAQALPSLFGYAGGAAEASAGMHQYWQVGLTAGPEAEDASGMRTAISTVLPQQVANHTTNYYWIGSYLADGSFIQVGYYVAWYNTAAAGWFYCAFTPSQEKGPCVYGAAGTAGTDGTVHTYALESQTTGAATQWTALVDGQAVGAFNWTSATTGQNAPGIYAESSGFAAHAAESTLGPVDFTQPIATRADGAATYLPAHHARPAYDAADVCPPYGAASDGAGGALLGSGLSCPPDNQWLW